MDVSDGEALMVFGAMLLCGLGFLALVTAIMNWLKL